MSDYSSEEDDSFPSRVLPRMKKVKVDLETEILGVLKEIKDIAGRPPRPAPIVELCLLDVANKLLGDDYAEDLTLSQLVNLKMF